MKKSGRSSFSPLNNFLTWGTEKQGFEKNDKKLILLYDDNANFATTTSIAAHFS